MHEDELNRCKDVQVRITPPLVALFISNSLFDSLLPVSITQKKKKKKITDVCALLGPLYSLQGFQETRTRL